MADLYPQRGPFVSDANHNGDFNGDFAEKSGGLFQAQPSQDSSPESIPMMEAREVQRRRTVPGKPGSPECEKNPDRGRRYDFVWLVYSVFFFIEPITRHNFRFWVIFLAFYITFLAVYTGLVFSPSKRQSYVMLVALWALGMAYLPFNNSIAGIFVYITAFIPFIAESIGIVLSVFGIVAVSIALEGYLLHIQPWACGFALVFSLIVGGANIFTAQRVRANAKLQLAQEEIEQLAKLAERERIARDLHDVLGHTLSVIVLKSELAGRLFERDPQRARLEIGEVEQVSRKALSEVREAIRGYRAEGLAAEIDRANRTLDAAGVRLTCESKPPSLAPAEETVLSLAVREAVTNIVRHAQASQCRMRFVTEDGRYSLTVEDDGRGNIRQEGNGLRGMRERIEALGGHFSIDGKQGTRLNIDLPIRPA
jgi:two-component system sensor histidine kinase DesK